MGKFKAGKAHGDGTFFHRNGTEAIIGRFVNGYLEGPAKLFDEDGRFILVACLRSRAAVCPRLTKSRCVGVPGTAIGKAEFEHGCMAAMEVTENVF